MLLALGSGEWDQTGPSRVLASTDTSLTLNLQPGTPLEREIEASLDHQNLWDPAGGYTSPRRHGIFVQRLELENTGRRILDRPWPVVNGRDLGTFDGLYRTVGFGTDSSENARRWYGFWSNYRYHDSSRTEAGRQLFSMISYWSYGFCGDDYAVQRQLFGSLGVKARRLPLNGHTAGEFFYQGDWHVLDGDRSAVYLELDNSTFASFEDIRRDPLLALRTKTGGRVGSWNAASAWGNVALFEYLNPKVRAPSLATPQLVPATGSIPWHLYPGEKLIFHYDRPPRQAVGKHQPRSLEWLATVEMVTDLELRRRVNADGTRRDRNGDGVEVSLPFPITEVIYDSGEAISTTGSGEPRFEITLDPAKGDRASVLCQAALRALPDPLKGHNRFSVRDGPVTLTLYWLSTPETNPPAIALDSDRRFFNRPVSFGVSSPQDLEKVWWQLSAHEDFRFVLPNWDNLLPYAARFEVGPLSSSFFRADSTYYLRARGFDGRLWSDWSEVKEITVTVPPQPTQVELHEAGGGHRLSWASKETEGIRFMVFGSNRRDFLPEIFGELEITEMENLSQVLASRPNRNLLGTTRQLYFFPDSPSRYYRVVAVKGQSYSVPSVLIHAPTGPPGRILQTIWEKEPADNALGYVDIYQTREVELPEEPGASFGPGLR